MAGQIFLLLLMAMLLFRPHPAEPATLQEIDRKYKASSSFDAIKNIEALIHESSSTGELQYEWTWRLARVYYRLGKYSSGEGAKAYFSRCIDTAGKAVELKPQSGPGYFYRALCTGKNGEAEGLWKSLEIIEPFKNDMETALKIDPAFARGGPPRALAKLYLELPFFLGGDLDKSLGYAKQAVKNDGGFDENHLYLAEIHLARQEPIKAQRAFSAFQKTARNPKQPESKLLFEQAEELRKKIAAEIEALQDENPRAYTFE